jgi:hypothetical protein
MVPRADFMAATKVGNAARVEVIAAASKVSTLEEQLDQAKQQLSSVQTAMAAMVPRSEFIAAKEQIAEMDARMRVGEERQRRLGEELKEQALLYQSEIDDLNSSMQVLLPHTTFIATVQSTAVRCCRPSSVGVNSELPRQEVM